MKKRIGAISGRAPDSICSAGQGRRSGVITVLVLPGIRTGGLFLQTDHEEL